MRKSMVLVGLFFFAENISLNAQSYESRSDLSSSSSTTKPSGAAYVLTSGAATISSAYTTSTSDYNVIQVTGGTLSMKNCAVTKYGDTSSSGDASSFYGTNSSVYVGGASSVINMTGGTITSKAKGANAGFAYNGGVLNISGVTIDNKSAVSRGLHATFGGYINAYDCNITTESATSSTIATDRGGGYVKVWNGTAHAEGDHSAVLYSTGEIIAHQLTGVSDVGEIAIVEGSNTVEMDSCTMTCSGSKRGLMMLQSGSGDASGASASITVNGGTLTTTSENAPLLEVPTKNTGTLTLTDVTLNVASGKLMYVDYNTQWKTYGGTGNLVLNTTQDKWSYTGSVSADSYSNATVTIGGNVTWIGSLNTDNAASSASATIKEGGVWVLTADSYADKVTNNGKIYLNGYSLNGTVSGNAVQSGLPTGINALSASTAESGNVYSLQGQRVCKDGTSYKSLQRGIYILKGKKIIID